MLTVEKRIHHWDCWTKETDEFIKEMQAFDAYDIKYLDEDDEGEAIEGSEIGRCYRPKY